MKNVTGLYCKTSLALAIGLLSIGVASAATVTVGDATGLVGGGATTPTVLPVTFGGDGVTVGYQTTLTYDTTNLDAVRENVDGGLCTVNDAAGTIVVLDGTADNSPLADKVTCNLTFTVGAGAADGDVYTLDLNGGLFSDENAAPSPGPHTETDGSITITNAPPDVVLAFNPDAAVVFPGGTSGDTTAESIDVTVGAGTVGTGTVDNCVISGANASAFSVVGGDPTTVPPAGSIDLEVTLANSALAATLTCDVADAGPDTTHVWALSAPAGTPVPAPEYSSVPAPGTTLNCDGTPGSLTQTSITITNTGLSGAGSDLDYSCVVSGAGFSIISGAADTLAVDDSATVTVQCTVPAEDAPAATGDLDCTSNDPANSANNYPLSSIAETAPPAVPQPNVVPASSLWSQLSLIGLLAALGLLVVGIRRNH